MRRHLQLTQQLFSVQVEIERGIDNAIGVWVGLAIGDPSQRADRQGNYFRGFAANFRHSGPIESATLQEETFHLDGSISLDLTLLEGGDKLKLVDGD